MTKFDDLINNLYVDPRKSIDNSSRYWDRIILCQAPSLTDKQQIFCPVNQQLDLDIIAAFGTNQPRADQYLLHCAPGWEANPHKCPVILLPAAGLDATSFINLYNMGYDGLQQQLVALGHRVFALTFSHSHGDNFYQAEQLADAIIRVKALCGTDQVDVLAHSKAGLAARIYLSNISATAYRGDVRRYIMLGTPNLGVDFAFRNPSLSLPIFISGSNGVIAWDKIFYLGTIMDTAAQAIYHDGCFPGQSQMLYRWDQEYPLDITQADWWTTYYGGQGFIGHSRGIDAAINDGGNLIARLERIGIAPGIEMSVLAGDNNLFGLVSGDDTAPSDGVVFLDSVFNTDGMASQGAKLRSKIQLHVNHWEMLYYRNVARWVDQQLRDD